MLLVGLAGTRSPRLYVYRFGQDDAAKCTALKLKRFGFVRMVKNLRNIPFGVLVLTPCANRVFARGDGQDVGRFGLAAIDCSWEKVEILHGIDDRVERTLPLLYAANPVNYAQPGRLSTLEALAGALIIAGFEDLASRMLSLYKWGPTFVRLNENLLDSYK